MEKLPPALRKDVAVAARDEVIECMQHDEVHTSATSFREQCFQACRIVREEHTPGVPLKLVGQVFGIERGTISNHWRGTSLDAMKPNMPDVRRLSPGRK
jgi:hypothetical protein